MQVEIQVWKEGHKVLVRNERFHINTFGKTLEEALENFYDALLLNLEDGNFKKEDITQIRLVLSYPIPEKKKIVAIQ